MNQMAATGKLFFPAINVNVCVTNSKFDNVYGCRHSLLNIIMRATAVTIGGKRVWICRYGDVTNGSAFVVRGAGARVAIAEFNGVGVLETVGRENAHAAFGVLYVVGVGLGGLFGGYVGWALEGWRKEGVEP